MEYFVECDIHFWKKGSPFTSWRQRGGIHHSLTFMTQYSISFIFDFKEHHSQNADSGKKPTVMPTCSFIAEKKLEFSHLFSESSPALKNSWLRVYKTIELLLRYFKGYLCDSNSFCRCLKQQPKMFR